MDEWPHIASASQTHVMIDGADLSARIPRIPNGQTNELDLRYRQGSQRNVHEGSV
jgi:hypothetical protein